MAETVGLLLLIQTAEMGCNPEEEVAQASMAAAAAEMVNVLFIHGEIKII
jgi:hypothetical protein